MEKIKKILRLTLLVCLIVLASIGIGISGGVPIPTIKSTRDSEKEKTELVDEKGSSKKGVKS